MKLIKNSGNDRVVDELRQCLAALPPRRRLDGILAVRFWRAPGAPGEPQNAASFCRAKRRADLSLLGGPADRRFRNRLKARWLARQCADWIDKKAEVRRVAGVIPQSALIVRQPRTGG